MKYLLLFITLLSFLSTSSQDCIAAAKIERLTIQTAVEGDLVSAEYAVDPKSVEGLFATMIINVLNKAGHRIDLEIPLGSQFIPNSKEKPVLVSTRTRYDDFIDNLIAIEPRETGKMMIKVVPRSLSETLEPADGYRIDPNIHGLSEKEAFELVDTNQPV